MQDTFLKHFSRGGVAGVLLAYHVKVLLCLQGLMVPGPEVCAGVWGSLVSGKFLGSSWAAGDLYPFGALTEVSCILSGERVRTRKPAHVVSSSSWKPLAK